MLNIGRKMALQSQDKPKNEEIPVGNSAPMTLEDYFEMELTSDVRHEYSGGYIQAMVFNSTEKEDEWLHVSLDNEESILKILDCEIKLKDIYENVE